ncbi:hypothetical protein ACFV98_28795 [Streptomyces violascens]|uniref:hypothetical protein n=1 Tax=Streptomyces violascens TaxID=67381 RepID=UPI003653190A
MAVARGWTHCWAGLLIAGHWITGAPSAVEAPETSSPLPLRTLTHWSALAGAMLYCTEATSTRPVSSGW